MVPQPQIYIAKYNLKNLAGPMSILNIISTLPSRFRGDAWPAIWRGCRFPALDKNDHGIMAIVILEAGCEEDGSRFL